MLAEPPADHAATTLAVAATTQPLAAVALAAATLAAATLAAAALSAAAAAFPAINTAPNAVLGQMPVCEELILPRWQ